MLDVLRPAFWALCLGLTLPLAMFIALEFNEPRAATPSRTKSRPVASRPLRSIPGGADETVTPSATTVRPVTSSRIVRLEPIQPESAADDSRANEILWDEQNDLAYEVSELRHQMQSVKASQEKQQLEQLHSSTQLLHQIQQATKLQELESRIRELSDGPVRSAGRSPGSATEPGSVTDRIAIELDEETPGRMHLELRQADLTEALRELARAAGRNLVVVPPVAGNVTLRLELVTYETALDALLTAGNLEAIDDGDVTTVRTRKAVVEPAAMSVTKPVEPERVSQVFRPGHVRASDVRKLIEPLLTPGEGQVSLVAHERSDDESSADRPEAILVRDRPDVMAAVAEVIREADTPPVQVLIEARVLSVRLTDQMKYGINFGLIGATHGPSPLSEDGLDSDRCENGDCPPGANEPGLRYGTVHAHIPQVVGALERIADLSVIAAPQILTVNGQQAELEIGEEKGYRALTTTGPLTVDGVRFVETGTRIRLRPRVSPDGLVRLDIRPVRRTLSATKKCDPPSVATAGMDTQVLVKDGDTVLIGGIVEETVRAEAAKVPVLGSLPLVGGVFRKSVEQLERSEVLVLLTPRVVVNGEPTSPLAGRVPQAERRHQVMREGQSLSNRRQAARRHYERALVACQEGDLSKARHEARDALELDKTNPKIVELHDSLERAARWSARPVVPVSHVIPEERPPVIPTEVMAPPIGVEVPTPAVDPYPQLVPPGASPTNVGPMGLSPLTVPPSETTAPTPPEPLQPMDEGGAVREKAPSRLNESPQSRRPVERTPRGIAPPDDVTEENSAPAKEAAVSVGRGPIVPTSRGVETETTRPLPQPRRHASPPRGKVLR